MAKAVAAPAGNTGPFVYCTRYWHYRAKKWMYAADYGYRAWRFLGRKKGA